MNQKELDVIFQITAVIHQDHFFKNKQLSDVQKWVAEQLEKSLGVKSEPVGASWGVLTHE